MSSNKTVIPGMENAYVEQPDIVKQTTSSQEGQGETIMRNLFGNKPAGTAIDHQTQKPTIGFLYSISKSGYGEFWPLHAGSNTIGRSSKNNICLGEATVSDEHAVLVVQQMKNPEKVIAWINDSGSTCGTMVNGESLDFERRECVNGDVITIGDHYDLYLILIDAKLIGLKVHPDFIATGEPAKEVRPVSNPYVASSQERFTQGFEQTTIPQGGASDLTNIGNKPANKPNGTIFL